MTSLNCPTGNMNSSFVIVKPSDLHKRGDYQTEVSNTYNVRISGAANGASFENDYKEKLTKVLAKEFRSFRAKTEKLNN